MTKACTKCALVKELVEGFYYSKGTFSSECKECLKKRAAEYRKKHRKRLAANQRVYVRKNAASIKAKQRARYVANCEEIKAERREFKKNNKERMRAQRLKKTYGLTPEDVERMLHEQNGLCSICVHEFGKKKFIDHCHSTGVVRGILCHHCNVGLGYFRDDIVVLQRAIEYLKRHHKAQPQERKAA